MGYSPSTVNRESGRHVIACMSNFRPIVILILLSSLLFLTACTSVRVSDYDGESPELDMTEFFSGDLMAYGVVKNWRGQVIRKFEADIVAYWENGVGTLEEDFIFDDGELDRRVWTLEPLAEDRYRGTAGDVVGSGEVRVAGNAAFLDYVLRIPFGDDSIDVRVDDRMYLVSPGILLNESSLRKFGFKVGELLLVITQDGALP